jgi:hypothetical protein
MAVVTGSADTSFIGGLVGLCYDGSIDKCYSATAAVSGGPFAGGLIGENERAAISNCYSTDSVIADEFSGGLIGNNGGPVINCYSTGVVTCGGSYSGGLMGVNSDNISSSYFLVTSGLDNGFGEPLTDEQMKQDASFASWDFVWETDNGTEDIWSICETVNYPKLAWEYDYKAGDSDKNQKVDFVDFAEMGLRWMQVDFDIHCGGMDLNGDGWVDLNDLAIIADNWLQ